MKASRLLVICLVMTSIAAAYCAIPDLCKAPLPTPKHGHYGPTVLRHVDATNVLKCNVGYMPVGNTSLTCLPTGTWMHHSPSCVLNPHYCQPRTFHFGSLIPPGHPQPLGSATYQMKCSDNYYRTANLSIVIDCLIHNETIGKLVAASTPCEDTMQCSEDSRIFLPPMLTSTEYHSAQAACNSLASDLMPAHLLPCWKAYLGRSNITWPSWLKGTTTAHGVYQLAQTTSGSQEILGSHPSHFYFCATIFKYACPLSAVTLIYPPSPAYRQQHNYTTSAQVCNDFGARLPDSTESACVQHLLGLNGASGFAWLRDRITASTALLSNDSASPIAEKHFVICKQSGPQDYCPFAYFANAHVFYEGRGIGSTANLSCDDAYHVRKGSSSVITCLKDTATSGKWSGSVGCELNVNYCPDSNLANGVLKFPTNRALNSQAVPVCDQGYNAYPLMNLTCTMRSSRHGDWLPVPSCIAIIDYCPQLTVNDSSLSLTLDREIGSTVTVNCDAGYTRIGGPSSAYVCTAGNATTGKWTGSQHCQDKNECLSGVNYCDSPRYCWNVPGSFLCCFPGYEANGGRCQKISNYCPALQPANGMMSSQNGCAVNEVLQLTCNHGYAMGASGSDFTCQAISIHVGKWSAVPACYEIKNYCPNASISDGSVAFPDGMGIGDTAYTTCSKGYRPLSGSASVCSPWKASAGVWNTTIACEVDRSVCTQLQHYANSSAATSALSCGPGYTSLPSVLRWCLNRTGELKTAAKCELINQYCGLISVENGNVMGASYRRLDDVIQLQCNDLHYSPDGYQFKCLSANATHGTWNASAVCLRGYWCTEGVSRKLLMIQSSSSLTHQGASSKCHSFGMRLPSYTARSCMTTFFALLQNTSPFWTQEIASSQGRSQLSNGDYKSVNEAHQFGCEVIGQFNCSATSSTLVLSKDTIHLATYRNAIDICDRIGGHLPAKNEYACVLDFLAMNQQTERAWLRDVHPSRDMAYTVQTAKPGSVRPSPLDSRARVVCAQSVASNYCPWVEVFNGTVRYKSSRALGDQAQLVCHQGYIPDGNGSSLFTCVRETDHRGRWSSFPNCILNQTYCPPLNLVSWVYFQSTSSRSIQSIARWACTAGTESRNGYAIVCISNGKGEGMWNATAACTVIPYYCPELFKVPGGQLVYPRNRRVGGIAVLHCYPGYWNYFDKRRVGSCLHRTTTQVYWETAVITQWIVDGRLTCVAIENYCKGKQFVGGALSTNKRGVLNSSETLQCDSGYKLDSDPTYACTYVTEKQGAWAGTAKCIIIEEFCPKENITNGAVVYQGAHRVHSTALLVCKAGFVATYGTRLTCRSGTWAAISIGHPYTPECKHKDYYCPWPPGVVGGHLYWTPSNTLYPVYRLHCHHGYEAAPGPTAITCVTETHTNGRWNATVRCNALPKYCPGLSIANSILSSTARHVYAQITVSCNPGYEVNGGPILTCVGGNFTAGRWNTMALCELKSNYCREQLPSNGKLVYTGSRKAGDTASLTCSEGYLPQNGVTFNCQFADLTFGAWSATPKCSVNNFYCPPILSFANGFMTFPRARALGATATVSCNPGYHALKDTVTCATKSSGVGEWGKPICTVLIGFCPLLTVENGKVVYDGQRAIHSKATPVCNHGYEKGSSLHTTTCRQLSHTSGRWSNSLQCFKRQGYCAAVNVASGSISYLRSHQIGSLATLSCFHGYVPVGDVSVMMCLEGSAAAGRWSESLSCRAFCPESSVPNGVITHVPGTLKGTKTQLACKAGYEAVKGTLHTCQAYNSTHSHLSGKPACKAISEYCPEMPSVNGSYSYTNNREHLATAILHCKLGFRASNGETFTCRSDGTWSNISTCAAIDNYCPIVHEDGGVTHYSGARQLGSTASCNCDPGYNSTGSLTCLVHNKNNGKWSSGHGCELIPDYCLLDLEVNNSRTSYPGNKELGSVAILECDKGYPVKGDPNFTCIVLEGNRDNGVWSGTGYCWDELSGIGSDSGKSGNYAILVSSSSSAVVFLLALAIFIYYWSKRQNGEPKRGLQPSASLFDAYYNVKMRVTNPHVKQVYSGNAPHADACQAGRVNGRGPVSTTTAVDSLVDNLSTAADDELNEDWMLRESAFETRSNRGHPGGSPRSCAESMLSYRDDANYRNGGMMSLDNAGLDTMSMASHMMPEQDYQSFNLLPDAMQGSRSRTHSLNCLPMAPARHSRVPASISNQSISYRNVDACRGGPAGRGNTPGLRDANYSIELDTISVSSNVQEQQYQSFSLQPDTGQGSRTRSRSLGGMPAAARRNCPQPTAGPGSGRGDTLSRKASGISTCSAISGDILFSEPGAPRRDFRRVEPDRISISSGGFPMQGSLSGTQLQAGYMPTPGTGDRAQQNPGRTNLPGNTPQRNPHAVQTSSHRISPAPSSENIELPKRPPALEYSPMPRESISGISQGARRQESRSDHSIPPVPFNQYNN
eukprot:scpid3655/ scgid1487/ Sushi, von Willebrand factor type A, EGF and pentraxin domain-containing protein 1; Polydom